MAAEHLQVQAVQQAVDCGDFVLRQANLARFEVLLHHAGDLLGLHLGVDAVLVVQVDLVGLQAAQASVDGLAYGLGAAVGGQRLSGLVRMPNFVAITTSSRTGRSA